MASYVLRRLAQTVLVFVGISFVIFAAVFLLPGNPVAALASGQPLPATVVHDLELKYHLNDPFFTQYGLYLYGLVHGNFGWSIQNDQSVLSLMRQRWPVTATLALTAWGIEILFGITVGIAAALRRGRPFDRLMLFMTVLAISVPIFVVAFTAQVVLGIELHALPVEGTASGWPVSYIMPAFALGLFSLATVGRLTRASLLESLGADYVRTAAAKGLPYWWVIGKHALRNSIIPVVTYLGIDLGFLLGGAVIVEGVFNLPGIGQLLYDSILDKDGPVVVGVATVLVLIFLIANLVVDVVYALADPRIRYKR